MDLEEINENINAARSRWENGDYQEAIDIFTTAIDGVATLATTVNNNEKAMCQKLINILEKEKQMVSKEERVMKETVAQIANLLDATGDIPPADPDVWPAPPPQPQQKTRSLSTNRRNAPASTSKSTKAEEHKGMNKSTSQGALADKKKKSASVSSENVEDVDDTAAKKDDDFNPVGYDRELVYQIQQTMSREGLKVEWSDIAGLEQPKKLFKQAIVLPLLMPDYFTGIRRPWRGVCMVGPPGTGKTLLAKAIATECQTTFFAVNCGDLASKWRGDSEKLVKLLFEMARHYAPSTIFFDEIDTIGSQRGSSNEHEASRRVKSQLLVEMDGFEEGKRILVLAATNFPWLLDDALKRRFEKRIYIPLPEHEARLSLVKTAFKELTLAEDVDLNVIAQKLEGFSGADINNVCRQAAMMGVGRLMERYTTTEIAQIANLNKDQLNMPVTMNDFLDSINNTNPSLSKDDIQRYVDWMEQYGSS